MVVSTQHARQFADIAVIAPADAPVEDPGGPDEKKTRANKLLWLQKLRGVNASFVAISRRAWSCSHLLAAVTFGSKGFLEKN
jgi:hypothetical protein